MNIFYRLLALLLVLSLIASPWIFEFALNWHMALLPLHDGGFLTWLISAVALLWWLVTVYGLWRIRSWALPNFATFAILGMVLLSISVVPGLDLLLPPKAAGWAAMTTNFGLACLSLVLWWNEKDRRAE